MCFKKEKENIHFSSQKNFILFNKKKILFNPKKKISPNNFKLNFFLQKKLLSKIIYLSWSKKIFYFILKLKSMVKKILDSSQFKKEINLFFFQKN
jgi:hypothetical protein